MSVSEEERLELLKQVSEKIGEEAASTLMESLPPFSWHELATKGDLNALKDWTEAKFERVDAQFLTLSAAFQQSQAELSQRISESHTELSKEIAKQTWVFVTTVAALAVAVCSTIAGGVFIA